MLVLDTLESEHCYYNQRCRKYDYAMQLPLISLISEEKMNILKKAQYKSLCQNKHLISSLFLLGSVQIKPDSMVWSFVSFTFRH